MAASLVAEAADPPGNVDAVKNIPGLVAFWTFGEKEGKERKSIAGGNEHSLREAVNPIARAEGGSYSGYSAVFDGKGYLHVPHAELKDLDIHGKEAQVSMFVLLKLDHLDRGMTVAGIWSEGKGRGDDTGTRQYSLLLNMPAYGGPKQLVPHISSEGGVTRRADGSAFPWCADYAANVTPVPTGEWVTLAFTYDSEYIRAYYNGALEERELDPEKDRRNDRYFTQEGPNGGPRHMNPYYHGKGIFQYDPVKHAESKPDGGSDFTVGACYAVKRVGNPLYGRVAGLAVFDRALSDDEIKTLHESAKLKALNREKGE